MDVLRAGQLKWVTLYRQGRGQNVLLNVHKALFQFLQGAVKASLWYISEKLDMMCLVTLSDSLIL